MRRGDKPNLSERTVAFLRQCARGRSRPATLQHKAAELLADRRLEGTATDYMNPRPGWWPDSGFAAQDRPDWS